MSVRGSLQELLTGQQGGRSPTLQVVGGGRGRLHLSDGQHVLTSCVAGKEETGRLMAGPANSLINITKWKLVQLVSQTGELEYGVRLDEFETEQNQEDREVIGSPKIMRVAVLPEKDPEESLRQIIVDFLENIKPEESKLSWAAKILKILKKSGRWWMCVVCKFKISNLLEAKVVSHAQAHLRYFPGYVCGCQSDLVVDNLVKYRKHLQSDQHKHAIELQKKNSSESLSKWLNSVETHLLTVPKTEDSEQATLEEDENIGDDDLDTKEDISKVAEELANFMAGDIFSQSWQPEKNRECIEEQSAPVIISDDLSETEEDSSKSDFIITEEDCLLPGNKRKIEEILIDTDEEDQEGKKSKLEVEEKPIVPFDWYREVGKLVEIRGKSFYCKDPSCWSSKSFGNQSIMSHIEKYHFKTLSVFRCGECGVDCDSLANHNAHMRLQHNINLSVVKEESESVTASQCFHILDQSAFYTTRNTGDTLTWEKEVKGLITKQGEGYGCSKCGYVSSPVGQGGKTEMLAHLEKSHLNIAGYRCSQCGFKSYTVGLFSQHLTQAHKLHLHLLQHPELFPDHSAAI